MVIVKAGLGPFFGFAEVNTFLLGMVGLFGFAAVAFDVRRALFSLCTTMLALCDWSTFLRNKRQFAVCVMVSMGERLNLALSSTKHAPGKFAGKLLLSYSDGVGVRKSTGRFCRFDPTSPHRA